MKYLLAIAGFIALSPVSAAELRSMSAARLAAMSRPLPRRNPVPAACRGRKPAFVPGRVLFKYADGTGIRTLRVGPGTERSAASSLRRRPDIAFAELDRLCVRQASPPNDPLYSNQWHHAVLGSPEAWCWYTGGTTSVAIVDEVFQMDHPDLSGAARAGWDFVNDVPIVSSVGYPADDHATLSAGLVAAGIDNGKGVAGMATVGVVPLRIQGYISEMVSAIYWAASNGVRVVNISWTGCSSATLNDAGEYLRNTCDGILVMAGENSGYLDYTNHPYITAVAATDAEDNQTTADGPHIDFSAPGESVYGPMANSLYGYDSGSSFAAPVVSGILAALLDSGLSAATTLDTLRRTSLDLGTEGRDDVFGWGRVSFRDAAWMHRVREGRAPEQRVDGIELAGDETRLETEYRRGFEHGIEYRPGATGSWQNAATTISVTQGVAILTTTTVSNKPNAWLRLRLTIAP